MFDAMWLIAERRISEAIREGSFNIEGWRNRPLPSTNDSLVPEDLRMAYKILKNAGYLPPEIEAKKEIQQVEDLLCSSEDECTKVRQMKKLEYLLMKLSLMRGVSANIQNQDAYYSRVVERISVGKKNPG